MGIDFGRHSLGTKSDVGRSPALIDDLPPQWFIPSEELFERGWPNFSVRSLTDWESSAFPMPTKPYDCCVVLAYPRVANPIEQISDWAVVIHETGGIWQERRRIVAKKLAVKERGCLMAHEIARKMASSNCSAEFASCDQLVEYRALLQSYGFDCNHHIQSLTEGFYPIDLTDDAFAILNVPREEFEAAISLGFERLCLAVMAPNSYSW